MGNRDLIDKLRAESLHKSYNSVLALRSTTLSVKPGEFLTLLGPSGSGKTTLLGILSGLVKADGGDVWIDGARATNSPPHSRGIGVVFQSYALFPHLTVFENIAFPLRMRRLPQSEINTKVSKILDLVQLPQHADRLPRELSGGQQQRVAFARSAVYEPSIILMDEPLGALDKRLRESMQLEIKRLHVEMATTIIYVTHDQEEAMTMSDRICLMNDGTVEQIGTPSELYFAPKTIFAADFLGTSNLLSVTVQNEADTHVDVKTNDGMFLKAPRPEFAVSPGKRLVLMVRPQHLRFQATGAKHENSLRLTVEDVAMAGALTRVHLVTGSRASIIAMEMTMSPKSRLSVGSVVETYWDAGDTLLLPEGTVQ